MTTHNQPNTCFHQSNAFDELMPELPVLEQLHDNLGGISNTTSGLFGLQHLFGSTASLIHRLAAGRISPSNVLLLGKPYSTNPRVAEAMRHQHGYWVHPDSTDQSCDVDNDSQMDARITSVLDTIATRLRNKQLGTSARYLMIDDGGRAIRLLHSDCYSDVRHRFTCVEQTRCGTRNIADLDLEVPVINVAESWVKLEHESPLIAESVIDELKLKLAGLTAKGITVSQCAMVIGYGAIGAAVASELKHSGHNVTVYDTNPHRLYNAARAGFQTVTELRTALQNGGVIIGCTGLPVLDREHYEDIADGSLLISASSADIEFRSWQLRSQGTCLGNPALWCGDDTEMISPDPEGRRWDHPCFSLYKVDQGNRSFFLVNGGFPVNFDGSVDAITPHKIQLTRSLLFLGAIQASYTHEAGIHDLDETNQQMLMDYYTAATRTLAA